MTGPGSQQASDEERRAPALRSSYLPPARQPRAAFARTVADDSRHYGRSLSPCLMGFARTAALIHGATSFGAARLAPSATTLATARSTPAGVSSTEDKNQWK
jgi:hypothetical protein